MERRPTNFLEVFWQKKELPLLGTFRNKLFYIWLPNSLKFVNFLDQVANGNVHRNYWHALISRWWLSGKLLVTFDYWEKSWDGGPQSKKKQQLLNNLWKKLIVRQFASKHKLQSRKTERTYILNLSPNEIKIRDFTNFNYFHWNTGQIPIF